MAMPSQRCTLHASSRVLQEGWKRSLTLQIFSNKRSSLRIAFRCYKRMAMSMTSAVESNIRNSLSSTFDHVIPLDKYIAKISNRARIDWRIQKLALEIARQTEDNILLSGKDPVGIASAYLYISACLWRVPHVPHRHCQFFTSHRDHHQDKMQGNSV